MNERPNPRRLQFKIRHLLILTTIIAVDIAYLSYRWPDHPLWSAWLGIGVLPAVALVWLASLFPERYSRWLRPLAVIISGILAMALGMWVRKNL